MICLILCCWLWMLIKHTQYMPVLFSDKRVTAVPELAIRNVPAELVIPNMPYEAATRQDVTLSHLHTHHSYIITFSLICTAILTASYPTSFHLTRQGVCEWNTNSAYTGAV